MHDLRIVMLNAWTVLYLACSTSPTLAPDGSVAVDVTPDTSANDARFGEVGVTDVVRAAITDRAPVSVEFMDEDDLITIVPDLDGDGRADVVRSNRMRTVVQLGWPARASTQVAFVREGTNLVVATGDLNHDGHTDLVLSST